MIILPAPNTFRAAGFIIAPHTTKPKGSPIYFQPQDWNPLGTFRNRRGGPIDAVLLPTGRSGQVLTFKRTDRDESGVVTGELLEQIAQSVKLAH